MCRVLSWIMVFSRSICLVLISALQLFCCVPAWTSQMMNNSTGAPTNSSKREYGISTSDIGLTVGFITTFLVSLAGNSLVIHVVRTTPSMYTSVNLYIANMAFSDIISATVCTPVTLRSLFREYSWVDGSIGLFLCRFVYFLFYSSFACSTFNLVAIALDRYLAVTKPLYRYSFRTVKINIAMIWMASSILSIPIIYGYVNKTQHHAIPTTCFDLDRDQAYKAGVTIMALLCYILPLLCATLLYTMAGCRLFMRTKDDIGCHSLRRKNKAKESAFKATKLMVTVIIVFALCWAPFFIYHVAKGWYDAERIYYVLKRYYRPLCFLLASTNGALNPLLYLLFNDNFRNGFRKALICSRERPRSTSFELRSSQGRQRSRSTLSTQIRLSYDRADFI